LLSLLLAAEELLAKWMAAQS